ncbi:HAD family hydrolase [Alisedimentitalea sp. MJ-SS2]|uniref:HAD family hydrolase n=1 Tax=Aliisedimentitalea sp. MJ-SS2 TaxID=3049795 RepID=UPI002915BBBD|nr:HAD family hydrolase [Alisedimentitalea sp. MJ-SS2]MDU8927124.1 HAD family hydrolase [Alisedimentitalea sp. MJ-SS2]
MGTRMELDGLIFDKDGTLFEFAATWEAWAAAFLSRACGGDRDRARELGTLIGFDFENQRFATDSIVIAGTAGEIADALLPGLPGVEKGGLLTILNEEAAQAPQAEAVPLVPYLERLKQAGLRLGVATNDAEMPAKAHLGKAGVDGLFEFVAGFDSGFGGKPAPGQLNAFLETTGLAAERVAMVGDSTHDLEAGRRAGMRTIAVLTGMAQWADLEGLADVVLPDIGHIPELLGLS